MHSTKSALKQLGTRKAFTAGKTTASQIPVVTDEPVIEHEISKLDRPVSTKKTITTNPENQQEYDDIVTRRRAMQEEFGGYRGNWTDEQIDEWERLAERGRQLRQ